ncbi:hypothetical protein ACFQY8_00430 [Alloscardovia venturai]|uniref:Putative mannosyltransferase YkcA/B-like C-terminal domain-containing protein n=1 Tax=Alloscardovia venturai TaxID=1769421 RepID=A0ABW2Y437_9BIFI
MKKQITSSNVAPESHKATNKSQSMVRKVAIGFLAATIILTPTVWSISYATATSASHASGGMSNGFTGGSGASSNLELISLLKKNASSYRWVAATTGSQNAASYQLATEVPVMAIGGFNRSDNYPTLTQFKKYVSEGLIHYYIAGGGMGGQQNGGSSATSQISNWVSENYTARTVGGVTIYDLT